MALSRQRPRRTAWIAGTAILVLALVPGLRMISRSAPDGNAFIGDKTAKVDAKQEPGPHIARERPAIPKVAEPAREVSKTKLVERRKSPEIRDLEKHGIFVEAERVGKNSASGKVRVTMPDGAVLEADRAKMSSGGFLVAEGNPVLVKDEMRAAVGGENGAMAIFYDEERQGVVMRAGAADKVTSDPLFYEGDIPDPDRGHLPPDAGVGE